MSNYTTEVRYICEVAAGYDESQERDKVSDIISAAIPSIFDFDFPIFDETYRPVLERKILIHYYTREIAHETVGLWKLKLETKLNEIMPYYNDMYKIAALEYNPLLDVDLTEDKLRDIGTATSRNEHEIGTLDTTEDNATNRNTSNEGSNSNTNLYSDTPQGQITNLAEGKYLTNATMDSGTTRNDGIDNSASQTIASESNTRNRIEDGTVDTTDDYVKHIKGKRGGLTYSKMLEEELALRDKLKNIDMRIIRDLKDLFFTLY